jgi:hypothetical protein
MHPILCCVWLLEISSKHLRLDIFQRELLSYPSEIWSSPRLFHQGRWHWIHLDV